MKNIKTSLSLIILSLFALSGCSDSSSGKGTTTYADPVECQSQNIPVGIQGNSACPYLGEIDQNGNLQSYALHYSGSIGIGFEIDFGWDYEDECPQDGQLPVFENGRFSYCTGVNPAFARTDFTNHQANNMGECAGEQYNMQATGCRPNLRPSQAQYNW